MKKFVTNGIVKGDINGHIQGQHAKAGHDVSRYIGCLCS